MKLYLRYLRRKQYLMKGKKSVTAVQLFHFKFQPDLLHHSLILHLQMC